MTEGRCKGRIVINARTASRIASYSAMVAGAHMLVSQAAAEHRCTEPETPLTVNLGTWPPIDIDGDGNNDFAFRAYYSTGGTGPKYAAIGIGWNPYGTFDILVNSVARRLAYSDTVNAAFQGAHATLMLTQGSGWYGAQFNDGTEGYIGVRFNIPAEGMRNGWVLFEGGTAMGQDITGTVKAWGYEDTGAASLAGLGCGPTLVELASFTASSSPAGVHLSWETSTEVDNAGFHVVRSEAEDGLYVRVNQTLIPAEGSSTDGACYSFLDDQVGLVPGGSYHYKLQAVDTEGDVTLHGSVAVDAYAPPDRPRIISVVGDAPVHNDGSTRSGLLHFLSVLLRKDL